MDKQIDSQAGRVWIQELAGHQLEIMDKLPKNYHVRIDDLIYGSPRESFHKFVKRSVNNDA